MQRAKKHCCQVMVLAPLATMHVPCNKPARNIIWSPKKARGYRICSQCADNKVFRRAQYVVGYNREHYNLVAECLQNAIDNGYEIGEPDEEAGELKEKTSGFEVWPTKVVAAYIGMWKAEKDAQTETET